MLDDRLRCTGTDRSRLGRLRVAVIEAQASRTALRVALRRAAHQVVDEPPLVFPDPLAVRILGSEHAAEIERTPESARKPFSAALRAWMVVRARFAEDVLKEGVAARGVRQALVLGAGLDTFAYRNPFTGLQVFEVDHPATQAWKRERLASAAIGVPPSVHLVPVNFETQVLGTELGHAGFDPALATATAWLGVAPYLTRGAFRSTLDLLGTFAPGSSVVFDYSQPREVLSPVEQLMHDSLSARVSKAGEPFQLFFTPEALRSEIEAAGMSVVEDLGSAELSGRYLSGRGDGLFLRGAAARLCHAQVA